MPEFIYIIKRCVDDVAHGPYEEDDVEQLGKPHDYLFDAYEALKEDYESRAEELRGQILECWAPLIHSQFKDNGNDAKAYIDVEGMKYSWWIKMYKKKNEEDEKDKKGKTSKKPQKSGGLVSCGIFKRYQNADSRTG